jgi:hypothetical protein
MTWVAVGAAAVTVVGGAIANNQSNKAAKGAANAQIAAQQQQYDQTRQDLAPYRQAGESALPLLQQLNGGNYSGFLGSPDYQAAYSQGIGALDNSAASRGALFSGGHEQDLAQFGSGLASQYLGNYRGSLFNMAQLGSNAATQTGQFGANAATNSGNALAGYYNQRGDNNSQFAAGTAGALNGLFQNYMAQRPGGGASSYSMPAAGSYTGLGGQPMLAQQQPAFGNNYGAFGNFNWKV